MASAVFILDMKGKVVICRNYRGDVPLAAADKFIDHVVDEEETNIKPVFQDGSVLYIFVKYANLYFLAVTQRNINVAMVVMFLQRLVETLKSFLGALEEETIRDNFTSVYELLDEMMDHGYPQTCEAEVLRATITQQSNQLFGEAKVKALPPPTGAVSWRQDGIKYKTNQVFLDVVEQVNLLVASNGVTLSSEIVGAILLKCELSGMPDCKLGLNDRLVFEKMEGGSGFDASRARSVDMEDIRFHQCVRLAKFDTDRTINFIPPDGQFELMSYRVSKSTLKPLIWVESSIEKHSGSRVELSVKLTTHYRAKSVASFVEVTIPVPPDADSPVFDTPVGACKYAPEKDAIIWTMKQLYGGRQYILKAELGLPSVQSDAERDARPPISVRFEVPYYTVSGIQVRYLKIQEKSNYNALPWVRYLTKSGDYQIRQGDGAVKPRGPKAAAAAAPGPAATAPTAPH